MGFSAPPLPPLWKRPKSGLELLADSYNSRSSYDEDSSDLISVARATLNSIKGSKFTTNSAITLIDCYADRSNFDESAQDLAEATCETIRVLRRTRRSIDDAVSLIETYINETPCEESASGLREATCDTLLAMKGTGFSVPDVVSLIKAYAQNYDQSAYDESAGELAEATCETIRILTESGVELSGVENVIRVYGESSDEMLSDLKKITCETIRSLGKNKRSYSDALSLVEAYSKQSGYSESASDLMDVSCKTLDYIALREMKVESMVERIERANNDLHEMIRNNHNKNLEEINRGYNFVYRWIKRWKENARYSCELAQSFSATDLCDHAINSFVQETEKSNKSDQATKDQPKVRRL